MTQTGPGSFQVPSLVSAMNLSDLSTSRKTASATSRPAMTPASFWSIRARASASRGTVSFEVASPLPTSSASACLTRSFTRRQARRGRIGLRWGLSDPIGSSTPHRTAWDLARTQYGVITHAQMIVLGYSSQAIQHRISRGRLHPIHRGVYAVGRAELTQEGEWMAAVLACGDTAALSHDSAAALWGIAKRAKTPIHVSVLVDSRSRNGIEVHRRKELSATTYKRIRVTTPAQTLIDLAHTWSQSELEQAIGEADLRRRVGLRALRTAATKAGRSGAPLRAIIDRVTFRVRQPALEREFLRLIAQADLPLPETQRRFGKYRVDS